MKRFLALLFSVMILFTYVLAVEDPVVEDLVAEDPVVEDPVMEDLPVEDPVVEDPVMEDLPVEDPVVEDPVMEDLSVEDPVVEDSVMEDLPAEEPVTKTPVDDPVSSGGGGGDVYIEAPDVYVMGSDIPADATITDISVMSLAPITPSDTSGLKAVLLSVIGDYDPVIIEYEYENNNGYTSYLREVQPDYVWQGSLLLFGLIIYCLFRLGGALIRD